jgi:hypothetical protein
MTEQEKLIKHIDKSMETLNDLYNDYRLAAEHDGWEQSVILGSLRNLAFSLSQDFNELERMGMFDEQPKTNDTQSEINMA